MNPSTTTLLSAFATLVAGTGASSAQEDCQTPRTPGGAPANLEHAIERSRQFAALVRADQKKPGLTAPCSCSRNTAGKWSASVATTEVDPLPFSPRGASGEPPSEDRLAEALATS